MLSKAIGYQAEVLIPRDRSWKPKLYLCEYTAPVGTASTVSVSQGSVQVPAPGCESNPMIAQDDDLPVIVLALGRSLRLLIDLWHQGGA